MDMFRIILFNNRTSINLISLSIAKKHFIVKPHTINRVLCTVECTVDLYSYVFSVDMTAKRVWED